uniref:Uncharacterized protein n=1 Tax=Arundo donax TaxID=35708 RepID=A0A0A8YTL2_ARUDO
MWRCNDELRAYANELHRQSSRKYARYYIEFGSRFLRENLTGLCSAM